MKRKRQEVNSPSNITKKRKTLELNSSVTTGNSGNNGSNDELNKYLNNLQEQLNHLAGQGISIAIELQNQLTNIPSPTEIPKVIENIVSHLEGIHCYLQFIKGKSYFSKDSITAKLTESIKNITALGNINYKPPRIGNPKKTTIEDIKKINKVNRESSFTNPPFEEPQRQEALYVEQARLNSLPIINLTKKTDLAGRFEQFLQDVWKYAIKQEKASKSVFFSHGWPVVYPQEVVHEQWIMPMTIDLARHLIKAGITVYIDGYHSGAGNGLVDFMNVVNQVDRVIVFNSQTWAYKMSVDISGVRNETKNIIDSVENLENKEDKQKFIIVVSLIEKNYAKEYFATLEPSITSSTISFYDHGYLEGLKSLICQLYDFNLKDFYKYWDELLKYYKINQDWWGIKPYDHCFIDQQQRLNKFTDYLANSENKLVILQGEEGAGKTHLALHYIYQCAYTYKAVYWFNASNEKELIENYIQFAQIKPIDKKGEKYQIVDIANWLAMQSNCLIIYDIKGKEAVELNTFLPKSGPQIIIISREHLDIAGKKMVVNSFNQTEAYQYLEAKAGEKRITNEQQAVNELLNILCNKENKLIMPRQLMLASGLITRMRRPHPIKGFVDSYKKNSNFLHEKALSPINRSPLISPQPSAESTIKPNFELISQIDLAFNFESNKSATNYYHELKNSIEQIWDECKFKSIDEFDNIFTKLLSFKKFKDETAFLYHLKVMLSHFESIIHIIDSSYPDFNYSGQAKKIIAEGQLFIIKDSPSQDTTYFSESVIMPATEDDAAREEKLAKEQQNFDGLTVCRNFLKSLWFYAFCDKDHYKFTKKIYIIFEKSKQEDWTTSFIECLIKHLSWAGILSYGREYGIKAELTNVIEQVDHVLVISSKALKEQEDSNEDLTTLLNKMEKKQKEKFTVPVLLNKKNYFPKGGIVAHGFCVPESYQDTLQALIKLIYNFDHNQFDTYCQRQRIRHKMINNIWGHLPSEESDIVERTLLLTELKDKIDASKGHAIVVATEGMGGIGKTTLISHYVSQNHDKYKMVFWFNASARNLLAHDYLQLGKEKGILGEKDLQLSENEQLVKVRNWLQKSPNNYLLIYDDASSNKQETIEDLLAIDNRHTVLITSRQTTWEIKHFPILVKPYSKEEAREYVTKKLGQDAVTINSEKVNQLIERLGCLPLALRYACAYLKQFTEKTGKPIADAIKVYLSHFTKINNQSETLKSIEMVLELTFKKMCEESQASITLLETCAFLYKNNIPYVFICQLFYNNEEAVGDAIRAAEEYSMLTVDEDSNAISMHELLQEVIIKRLQNKATETFLMSASTLKTVYPYQDYINVAEINLIKTLYIHLETTRFFFSEYQNHPLLTEQNNELAALKLAITLCSGDASDRLADYIKARGIFEEICKNTQLSDCKADELSNRLRRLAIVYGKLGLYKKQKQKLKEAQELLKNAMPANGYQTELSKIFYALAQAYNQYNNPIKAIMLLHKAFEQDKKRYLTSLSDQTALYSSLACSYLKLEHYYAAKLVLKSAQQTTQFNQLIEIKILHNLALTYSILGSKENHSNLIEKTKKLLNKAEQLFKETLKVKIEIYGEENNETLGTYHSLSQFYEKCLDFEQAIKYIENVKKVQEKYNNYGNYDLINTLEQLGNLYINLGNKSYGRDNKISDILKYIEKGVEYLEEGLKKTQEEMKDQEQGTIKQINMARISVNLYSAYEFLLYLYNQETQDSVYIVKYSNKIQMLKTSAILCNYGLVLFNHKLDKAVEYFEQARILDDNSEVIYTENSYLCKELKENKKLIFKASFIAHYWLIHHYHQYKKDEECNKAIQAFKQLVDKSQNPLHKNLLEHIMQYTAAKIIIPKEERSITTTNNNAKSELKKFIEEAKEKANAQEITKRHQENEILRINLADVKAVSNFTDKLNKIGFFCLDMKTNAPKKIFFASDVSQEPPILLLTNNPTIVKKQDEISNKDLSNEMSPK